MSKGKASNISKKDGFITIEFTIVCIALFALLQVAIGAFLYTYPTFALQREIDVLTRQIQTHGGLRNEDAESFKERVSGTSFVRESNHPVEIHVTTSPNKYNAMGVTDTDYISKQENETINLLVKVPSNNKAIKKFTNSSSDFYEFKSSVVSEKY